MYDFELFLHMLLKFEIIWTRIGQVIRLWNDIEFFETPFIICSIDLAKFNIFIYN